MCGEVQRVVTMCFLMRGFAEHYKNDKDLIIFYFSIHMVIESLWHI